MHTSESCHYHMPAKNNNMKPGVLVASPDIRSSLMSIIPGLMESGYLRELVTTLALSSSESEYLRSTPLLGSLVSGSMRNRVLPDTGSVYIRRYVWREILRTLSSRIFSERYTHRVWKWAEVGFDRFVARYCSGRYEVLYGMEHCSLDSFRRQNESGGRCVLRMVTVHGNEIRKVLMREAERYPQFITPYHKMLITDDNDTAMRKSAEYELADTIVCNSEYVKQSLVSNGIEGDRVVAIPTGCPVPDSIGARSGKAGNKLRFLYVGTLSFRKGFLYLLDAWKKGDLHRHAELVIAGKEELPVKDLLQGMNGVTYRGVVKADNLRNLFRSSDVFVMPSLAEGLCHAVLEALSFGMPVITTRESGAEGLVQPDANGCIITSSSSGDLLEAMQTMITNRKVLPEMGRLSVQKASAWTVHDSNHRHLEVMSEMLDGTGSHTREPAMESGSS